MISEAELGLTTAEAQRRLRDVGPNRVVGHPETLLAAGVLSAYLWVVWSDGAGATANTIAFMALVLIHPFQAMNCRSTRLSWWQLPRNPWVPSSLIVLFGLQWLAIEYGPLARLLGTAPLGSTHWLALAVGVLWPVGALEIWKAWGRLNPLRLSRFTGRG